MGTNGMERRIKGSDTCCATMPGAASRPCTIRNKSTKHRDKLYRSCFLSHQQSAEADFFSRCVSTPSLKHIL
eukprot:scaffold111418_cov17-Tisochrysis_lutea.AAC.1